jgi:hypothetical protein
VLTSREKILTCVCNMQWLSLLDNLRQAPCPTCCPNRAGRSSGGLAVHALSTLGAELPEQIHM